MSSRNTGRVLWILGIVGVIAVFAFADREWHCGATITKRSAGQIQSPGKVKHVGPVSIGIQQYGTILTRSDRTVSNDPSGSFQMIDLPGKHNYHFDYTGDVSKIRIRSDSQLVYDGRPVARLPTRIDGRLGIDFEWNEQSGSVTVFDRCSIRSHWDWLTRRLGS